MGKILHVGAAGAIMNPFVDFIKNNFDFNQHMFLLIATKEENKLAGNDNVYIYKKNIINRLVFYFNLVVKMHKSKKIVLHGLFDSKLVFLLFLMPWLLKKCYWVVWGGDLYTYHLGKRDWSWKVREFFRRPVIKNMGYLVTYIKGDYELAQNWYGSRGEYKECLMYTSNLYKAYEVPKKKSQSINVLVGNSADPSNNHLEIFDKLANFKGQDIKIYMPLSYGKRDYALEVSNEGRKCFGDKFIAIEEFMPFNKYLEFLGEIDIAVFNHKRQQAMGNTITLLGLGKKVYIRSDVTQWDFFQDNNIFIFDNNELDLSDFKSQELEVNKSKVKSYFSEKRLFDQWYEVFN